MSNTMKTDTWYKSSCHIDTSLWGKTAPKLPELEVLNSDIKADVAVIGAGFCGLSSGPSPFRSRRKRHGG